MKKIAFLLFTILLVLSVTACSGDDGKQDGVTEHEHIYAETLSFDETHHWYRANCSVEAGCSSAVKDKVEHTFDADGKCVCGKA